MCTTNTLVDELACKNNDQWQINETRKAVKEADGCDFASIDQVNAVKEKWKQIKNYSVGSTD